MSQSQDNSSTQNEALMAKAIARILHDLRTPLATIKISNDLLQNHHHQLPESKIQRYYQRISLQTSLMTEMIEEIGKLSRTGQITFAPKPTSLNQALAKIIEMNQQRCEDTHQLIFSKPKKELMALIDVKLLRQVFNNLIQNAVKYSPNADKVEITLQEQELYASICVSDQGVGIPESDLSKIFDSRFRANNVDIFSGTGLGLAVVKTSVELLGGEIEVSSIVNQGTSFTITLPYSDS